MNAQGVASPLAELRDIHLPREVPLWPPAPGWWIAAGLLLASIIGLALYRRWREGTVRAAALRELDALQAAFAANADLSGLALGVSELLRRVALALHPREDVAELHGPAWSAFLERTGRGRISTEEADRIALAVYARPGDLGGAPPNEAGARWISSARSWIGRAA